MRRSSLALALALAPFASPILAQRSPLPAVQSEPVSVPAPRRPIVGTVTAVQRDVPAAAALATPDYAPPDGGDPYQLDFEGGAMRPEPGLDPRLLGRMRAEPEGRSFAMVMLNGKLVQERVDELTARGATFLGVHPWQCVKVHIPHAAVPEILRLPSVRWVGLPEPRQKLSPRLAAAAAIGAERLHVHVNLFASELSPLSTQDPIAVPVVPAHPGARGESRPVLRWRTRGAVLARLEALGFDEESWDEFTRSYRGTLPTAALDAVLFVAPVAVHQADHAQRVAMIHQDRVRGTYPGQGVAVGIIDTGINGNPWHVDYSGKWYWWWDNTGLGATNDLNGHGTHVAGTVFGDGNSDQRLMGMAPAVGRDSNARVFIGRYLDASGNAFGDPGWLYSAFANPPGGRKPAVVNNSWSVDTQGSQWNGTEIGARQIDGFVHAGDQTYCYAAGNDASGGTSGGVGSPGSAKNVITVGSVDVFPDANGRSGSRSSFSDFGVGGGRQKPDLMAPGSVITSCLAGTLDQYTQKSGTSMATPHVTGVVASLADNNAWFEYNPAAVKALLLATASNGVVSGPVGHGLVDSHRANFGWNWVYAGTLSAPFTWSYFDIDVPANMATMKVVTTWVEPPVSAGGNVARVNNLETYLDIEPFSNSGTDGWPITSSTDNVTTLFGRSALAGIVNQCLGRRVRVKVYANSIFPGTNAKWSVCVSLGFADGTGPMQFSVTPSATLFRPNTNFTVQTTLAPGAGNVDLESARIVLVTYGSSVLSLMQRTSADGVIHAFGGTGYWSYPFPTVGDMTVGSGALRDLLFSLRTPTTSGIVNLRAWASSQGRSPADITVPICVDGQAPNTVTGLISPTHSVNAWSRNPDVRIDWSAAVDVGCAGIAGLAWTFDQSTSTVPTVMNLTNDPRTQTIAGLASSINPYHFAIRAVDRTGNLSATTARLGGFLIDTLAPSLLSVAINGGATYTTSTRVDLTFGASDAPSGVSIISYSLDGTTWSSFDPYTGFATNFDLANPAIGGNAPRGQPQHGAERFDHLSPLPVDRQHHPGLAPDGHDRRALRPGHGLQRCDGGDVRHAHDHEPRPREHGRRRVLPRRRQRDLPPSADGTRARAVLGARRERGVHERRLHRDAHRADEPGVGHLDLSARERHPDLRHPPRQPAGDDHLLSRALAEQRAQRDPRPREPRHRQRIHVALDPRGLVPHGCLDRPRAHRPDHAAGFVPRTGPLLPVDPRRPGQPGCDADPGDQPRALRVPALKPAERAIVNRRTAPASARGSPRRSADLRRSS
ncbi:MAG: S8 family serine peptidase [Planctomycetes bacterium]|nr:S8 family serine peptidase [Planctomycetota bacterium]